MSPSRRGRRRWTFRTSSTERPRKRGSVQGVNGGGSGVVTNPINWRVYVLGPARQVWKWACRLIVKALTSAGVAGALVIWQGIHSPAETPGIRRYVRGSERR